MQVVKFLFKYTISVLIEEVSACLDLELPASAMLDLTSLGFPNGPQFVKNFLVNSLLLQVLYGVWPNLEKVFAPSKPFALQIPYGVEV